MASKLQHLDSYPFSTERLWAIFTTEQYWHDLVERMNAGHGHVEKVTIAGETVTVEMNQGIPAERLPSAVTKIMPGDLRIPRRNTYRLVGDRIVAEMHATVEGAPVPVNVYGTITTSGDPATSDCEAEVSVNLPMFGGKIEKAVVSELVGLLEHERGHTVDWDSENRLT
ncbi:DUF2505 domain-containing protein [Gordonia amicalis]|uniref:DUF2505 domain-containing protein n=1 Tax=Gordonia amicalis TaxID=89053 RepID=A0AAE4R6C0_9ACTN|nr:DUF2505 domain-containing protein [Gordonia amicalis]MBA5846903.1 DUF2505 domain-containing protein [Gordonia amicalis]MDV6313899.1 DUF2505 domain-containing protein [Gordonia amicalis]MDV7175409.1 DUF2505 domain-containing protein [Gordonia amicalis]